MIVVQVLILDPQKQMVQNQKKSTYFKWISGFVGKAHFFHIKHQDWLIDLHSMKASEIGNGPWSKSSGRPSRGGYGLLRRFAGFLDYLGRE